MIKKIRVFILVFSSYIVLSCLLEIFELSKTEELSATKVWVFVIFTLIGTGVSFWIVYKLSCLLVFFVSGKRDEDYTLIFSLIIGNVLRAATKFVVHLYECGPWMTEILSQVVFVGTLACVFCIIKKNMSTNKKMIVIIIVSVVDQIGVLIERFVNAS